ncbi:MAG: D-alanyl-D-alanine carboxypeptidase, partial [Rhodospirillaceae bacterium]
MRNIGFLRGLKIAGTAFLLIITSAWPIMAKYASVVIDAETGRVYHEVNADTRNYPASLTKMMTLYI